MLIYWFNFLTMPLYRLLLPGHKNKSKFLFLVCLQMFLILSIRSGDMTVDEWQYDAVFTSIRQLSFGELVSRWSFFKQMDSGSYYEESGYCTLSWIFSNFLGVSFHTYLVFLALLHMYCMYKFLDHFSDTPLLGSMIFQVSVFPAYIQLLKRSTSTSLVFLAYCAVSKKQYKKAFAIMLLAVTMHRTALLFFIFIVLSQIKINKSSIIKTFYFMMLTGALVPFITPVVSRILALLNKTAFLEQTSVLSSFANLKMVVSFVVIGAIYLFTDIKTLQTDKNNVLCWILLFYVAVIPAELQLHILTSLSLSFTPPLFLLITNIIAQRRDRLTRNFLWGVAFIFVILLFCRWIARISSESARADFLYSNFKTFWF